MAEKAGGHGGFDLSTAKSEKYAQFKNRKEINKSIVGDLHQGISRRGGKYV